MPYSQRFITNQDADQIEIQEYEKFSQHQIAQNSLDDFDRFIESYNLKR